jgi:hypothetical protein
LCALEAVRVVPETAPLDDKDDAEMDEHVIAPDPIVPIFVRLRDESITVVPAI